MRQPLVPSTDGARVGPGCGVYTATNNGEPGGWCAKGKRFSEPLDLSRHKAVALWVHGDGKRETLRFQFRDVSGAHADWLVPIDFTGWRLHVFETADAPGFDWSRTEYVIFYYNGIPSGATVTLKLDDLKAFPELQEPPLLSRPEVTVNGKRLSLPVELAADEALSIEGKSRCTIWRRGLERGESVEIDGAALVLKPGANGLELSCDESKGAPRDVSVHVLSLEVVE